MGITVLYRKGQSGSKRLAEYIAGSQTIMDICGNGYRKDTRGLHVLREFNGAASVLIEVGFITNPNDVTKIQNNTFWIGAEIAAGIYKYINGTGNNPYSKLIPR
ncbi:MAG: N-acetylmuramoyl-L-alanine amidase [Saprospiraceae bacterium]